MLQLGHVRAKLQALVYHSAELTRMTVLRTKLTVSAALPIVVVSCTIIDRRPELADGDRSVSRSQTESTSPADASPPMQAATAHDTETPPDASPMDGGRSHSMADSSDAGGVPNMMKQDPSESANAAPCGPGQTSQTCVLDHATATCDNGLCQIQRCALGFADCDSVARNGCEAPLDTVDHCGACNITCSKDQATTTCEAGACQIAACAAGYQDWVVSKQVV